jgi:hypothetical protein
MSYECSDEGTRTWNIPNLSTRSHALEEEYDKVHKAQSSKRYSFSSLKLRLENGWSYGTSKM